MVWSQIRADILSILIWVQTVCIGYQQTTKVATSKARVKDSGTQVSGNCFKPVNPLNGLLTLHP